MSSNVSFADRLRYLIRPARAVARSVASFEIRLLTAAYLYMRAVHLKTRQHRQPGMKGRSQQAQTPETDTQPDAGQPAEQKRGRHGKGSGDAAQAGSQSSGKRGRRSRDAAPAPVNSQTPAATDPAAVTESTIDFDAMVTKGAISQAACDRIKAYLQEHPGSTLKDLLSASIITQAEYDALTAVREATAV